MISLVEQFKDILENGTDRQFVYFALAMYTAFQFLWFLAGRLTDALFAFLKRRKEKKENDD